MAAAVPSAISGAALVPVEAMRLAIYVPKAAADRWSPDEGSMSFDALQKGLVALTGYVSVTQATAQWRSPVHGTVTEAVLIVEAIAPTKPDGSALFIVPLWQLLRQYAKQLLDQGEESVLIVQDNEPIVIDHDSF